MALVRYRQPHPPPPPPHHNHRKQQHVRNITLALQSADKTCAVARTNTSEHRRQTIAGSDALSHRNHSETWCRNVHATTQIHNRNTAVQRWHPSHCARNNRDNVRPRHALLIVCMLTAHMAPQARHRHFRSPNAHLTHRPTRAALPTTITSHTRACADTHDATSPNQHTGTSASWRVSAKAAHTNKPHTAHSHTAHKHTNSARPHDVPHSRNHRAVHPHHHTHATHSTAHSSNQRTRCPQKITPSHTRSIHAALTLELGCPALTGCCRKVGCCSTPSTCRTREQPSRHTMASDAAADPSQPPATHRSASHSVDQIKSNESRSAHCMLSLTHNTV
jgi:hypothetical protein